MNAVAMRTLAEMGLSLEQIVEVAEALETDRLDPAEKRRARNRRYYRKRLNSDALKSSETVLNSSKSRARVKDKPLRLVTSGKDRSEAKASSLDSSFEEFWLAYPKKVAKAAARPAYGRALAKLNGDGAALILSGLETAKRSWKDPQFIPHPATWLNQERWADEGDASPAYYRQGELSREVPMSGPPPDFAAIRAELKATIPGYDDEFEV